MFFFNLLSQNKNLGIIVKSKNNYVFESLFKNNNLFNNLKLNNKLIILMILKVYHPQIIQK